MDVADQPQEPAASPAPPTRAREPPTPASPRWVWLGLLVVVALYLGYSSFGIAEPGLWGHYGHHGAEYTARARMTLRYGLVVPATEFGFAEPPSKLTYYLHHPIGYHHVLVPFIKLLGDAEWVPRSVSVLCGLLTLWALFRLVRRFWSPAAGLLATAVYVTLPILCSFSILPDPMLLEMACCLVAVDSFLRYQTAATARQQRRLLGIACGALFVGGLMMWEVNLLAFLYGLYSLIDWSRRRRSPATVSTVGLSPQLRWLLATFVATVIPFGFHFLFTWRVGMLHDFFESYDNRRAADRLWALHQHWKWLRVLYGPHLITVGLVWLTLFLSRLLRGRARLRDVAVVTFFLINGLYAIAFARGAAIHLYRVFFYSSFLTLAVVDLACCLPELFRWLLARLGARPTVVARGGCVGLALALGGYFALDLPKALHNLRESRVMMGTHQEPNYDAQYLKHRFAMEVGKRLGPTDHYLVYKLPFRIEFMHYADSRHSRPPSLLGLEAPGGPLSQHPRSLLLIDGDAVTGERRWIYEALRHHPGALYHPYLMIDYRPESQGQSGLREYRFVPQPSDWRWRWFHSAAYPRLEPTPELSSYGQCLYAYLGTAPPVDLPPPIVPKLGPSADTEPLICYHNYLVASGQVDAAAAFRQTLQPLWSSGTVAAGGRWLGTGTVLGWRIRREPGPKATFSQLELWLLLDHDLSKSPTVQRRFRAELRSGLSSQAQLLSNISTQPWLWNPQAGQLITETLRLPRGRNHLVLHSDGIVGPPGTSIAASDLDLGEIDLP